MQEYISKTDRIQGYIREVLADEKKHSTWINVNKVDSKKRKNHTDINIASFWLGVRPLLCE